MSSLCYQMARDRRIDRAMDHPLGALDGPIDTPEVKRRLRGGGGRGRRASMGSNFAKGGAHMAREEHIFTSESVTEGHPDKMADQVSDAVLDAIIAQDPTGRVACETVLTTGLIVVAGEITTSCYVDIPRIARDTVKSVGYTRAKYGFDYETCGVIAAIDEQSADIAMGVDNLGAKVGRAHA